MNILKMLFSHRCDFNKPIVSKYRAFNTRAIIYQCRCGKRKAWDVTMPFSRPFPISTNHFLSGYDFDEILKGAAFENIGELIVLKSDAKLITP